MLNCKLLSTQAVGIKHLYLHDVIEIKKSSMASCGRTLARTLCFGDEPNYIARKLNLCYMNKIIIKSKFRASNTLLKVHKRENFLGFDFEICTFLYLVMHKC